MKCALLFVWLGISSAALAATVSGRVVEDHSNSPLALAEIRVVRIQPHTVVVELDTDPQGRFQSPELPPAKYRLEIAKPNYVSTVINFEIRAGQAGPNELTGRLIHNAAFTGMIRDRAGSPVAGVMVFALPKNGPGGPTPPAGNFRGGNQATSDERGNFRLFGIAPGHYMIAASYGASTVAMGQTGEAKAAAGAGSGVMFYPSTAQPQVYTVAGGEDFSNLIFTLGQTALFTVSGSVEAPPKPDQIWLALAPSSQPAIASVVTVAKADGAFEFNGVAPGEYQLFAAGPSRGRNSQGAMLEAKPRFARRELSVSGQNVEGLSIQLQPGKEATVGIHSDPACSAAAKLTLVALEDWAAIIGRTVDAGPGKDLKLENLAPARYDVQATSDGCYQSTHAVLDLTAASTEPTIINLASLGSIRGKLKVPGPSAVEIVLSPIAFTDEKDPLRIELAGPDSRFEFSDVRPGAYRLAARQAGRPAVSSMATSLPGSVAVDVRGGPATEIELGISQEKN